MEINKITKELLETADLTVGEAFKTDAFRAVKLVNLGKDGLPIYEVLGTKENNEKSDVLKMEIDFNDYTLDELTDEITPEYIGGLGEFLGKHQKNVFIFMADTIFKNNKEKATSIESTGTFLETINLLFDL